MDINGPVVGYHHIERLSLMWRAVISSCFDLREFVDICLSHVINTSFGALIERKSFKMTAIGVSVVMNTRYAANPHTFEADDRNPNNRYLWRPNPRMEGFANNWRPRDFRQ